MKTWHRLLTLHTQPASLRECYALLERFADALQRPGLPLDVELAESDAARLGYLIEAFKLVAGTPIHPNWVALAKQLHKETPAVHAEPIQLLRCDDGSSTADALAVRWGLSKGLDSMKLVQIGLHGAV